MKNKTTFGLFMVSVLMLLILFVVPVAEIDESNKSTYQFYIWGYNHLKISTHGENIWSTYFQPTEKISFVLGFSLIFLIGCVSMIFPTLYYFFRKEDVALKYIILVFIQFLLSFIFLRFGIYDTCNNIKVLSGNADISVAYLYGFPLFILALLLMGLSFVLPYIDVSMPKFKKTKNEPEERSEEVKKYLKVTPPGGVTFLKEKPKDKNNVYSMITVLAGVAITSFCLFLFFDAYRVINNPLFGFQSEDIQYATWFQLFIGICGGILGIVFMVKGFIDYIKER